MKKSMLLLSAALAVFLTSSGTVCADSNILVCDKNGDFTALIVSDPQCDTELQWQQAKDELETLVVRCSPDFVLINGDINSKNLIPEDMWNIFISPLESRGIFWSTANGNHDPFKYRYYKMYKSYKNCLNSTVSIFDKNYDFERPMNYCLPVYSNNGKKIVFAIYVFDSGTLGKNGYDGVTSKQINWYISQSEKLKKQNGGKTVTSMLCMHIPLPQTVDMYYSTRDASAVSGETSGGFYTVYGVANEPKYNKKGYVCENGTAVSKVKIHTSSPTLDSGLFEAALKQGDIKAFIFGHDHCTNIIGSYNGVLLGFAGKLSTGCYSDELCRGGRVIRFNQSDPESFTAEWLGALESCEDQPPVYSDGTRAY